MDVVFLAQTTSFACVPFFWWKGTIQPTWRKQVCFLTKKSSLWAETYFKTKKRKLQPNGKRTKHSQHHNILQNYQNWTKTHWEGPYITSPHIQNQQLQKANIQHLKTLITNHLKSLWNRFETTSKPVGNHCKSKQTIYYNIFKENILKGSCIRWSNRSWLLSVCSASHERVIQKGALLCMIAQT